MSKIIISSNKEAKATEVVAKYTIAASVTGAVPLPLASTAIVAQNAAMLTHVSRIMGVEISMQGVAKAIGLVGAINMLGRRIFLDLANVGAKVPGAGWLAQIAVSSAGAATAGFQTYLIGLLAIEIGKNGGKMPSEVAVKDLTRFCRASYQEFLAYWKARK